ncbi:hypothetical protein GC176_24665 [bacterium]|nr:hypothetical protein [bacterium]
MSHPTTRKATAVEQAQAKHAFLCVLIEQGEGSTDDAHQRYELPESVNQSCWGGLIAGLLAAVTIDRVGDRHTSRSKAHGRRIGRFRLTDREQAIALRDRLAAVAARKRDRQQRLPGVDA